jgi:transcriptional regulator
MYIPGSFAETHPRKLRSFIHENSFATLVTRSSGELVASHLPLLFDANSGPKGELVGHMALANSQWRDVTGEALAIFTGPHTYISPTWYEEAGTVPTWNYVAVHVHGQFQVVENRVELLGILRRSVHAYEGQRSNPWQFDESAEYINKLLNAIVGFRIAITKVEGKWKLSQNHSPKRRERVVRALESRAEADSPTIALLMRDMLAGEFGGATVTSPEDCPPRSGQTPRT